MYGGGSYGSSSSCSSSGDSYPGAPIGVGAAPVGYAPPPPPIVPTIGVQPAIGSGVYGAQRPPIGAGVQPNYPPPMGQYGPPPPLGGLPIPSPYGQQGPPPLGPQGPSSYPNQYAPSPPNQYGQPPYPQYQIGQGNPNIGYSGQYGRDGQPPLGGSPGNYNPYPRGY